MYSGSWRLLPTPARKAQAAKLIRMRFVLLASVMLCLCGMAPGAKKPDMQILECRARRVEAGKIAVDGRIRNTGAKPLKGLVVFFDFLSSENEPLTTEKIEVGGEALDPGEESSFHAETMNPPGAVSYRLRATDSAERQLRIANSGPFVIE